MESTENKRFVYAFGSFVLDPHEKTLLADGVPVRLPAKEFETLLLLIENNGKALSKDEMMAVLWQDAFVEESNLAKQVSKLRKVLNTNGEQFIETLPKHGYRFSADLRLAPSHGPDPILLEKRTVRRMTFSVGDGVDETPLLLPKGSTSFLLNWKVVLPGLLLLILLSSGLYYFLSSGASTGPVRSLAVLPFKSASADASDEFLRLGLTDALITKLSHLKHIVVRPTNAVRKYETTDPIAAGRELGVDAVLDANVQRSDQNIRVTVQLIDIRDGRLLWGRTLDEQFTDIFNVQDAISDQVARAIVPGLTGEEKNLLAKRYTANPEAHHAYVMGRFFWNRRTGEDLKQALDHFNEAVRKDPNYALAFVGLADTYSLLADYSAAQPGESYARAKSSAERALELDDGLAEAHTSLAYVRLYYDWDWPGSDESFRRAIALNPNYATARQWYSEYLTAMGRFDDALAEIRRAREIDPLSPVIHAGEVWILYHARRYDEAIEKGRKITSMSPEFAEIHEYMKRCYDQKGMYREAVEARQERRKLAGYDPTLTPTLRAAAAAQTPEEYWSKRLDQEVADANREQPESFDMAEISAQLGDKEQAFHWLEYAYQERNFAMVYLKVAPNLDPLRSDSRYADLVRRVSLAP